VGQFIFAYEFQTAIMGNLLEINPYDQPGVELGKKVTYALMGRKGYEDFSIEVENKLKNKKQVTM